MTSWAVCRCDRTYFLLPVTLAYPPQPKLIHMSPHLCSEPRRGKIQREEDNGGKVLDRFRKPKGGGVDGKGEAEQEGAEDSVHASQVLQVTR